VKIVVMRHGKPEIDLESLKSKKVSPLELGKVLDAYECSDLGSNIVPSKSVLIAKSCKVTLSSDLPRAISSIKRLEVQQDQWSVEECFREVPLPYPNWEKPFFPVLFWCFLLRLAWFLGFANNGESIRKARQRAQVCVSKIIEHVDDNESVLLLGHGIINHLIGSELKENKWVKVESTGKGYWSYAVYEPSTV
jgi:broad specificity phosphatase PhoE